MSMPNKTDNEAIPPEVKPRCTHGRNEIEPLEKTKKSKIKQIAGQKIAAIR